MIELEKKLQHHSVSESAGDTMQAASQGSSGGFPDMPEVLNRDQIVSGMELPGKQEENTCGTYVPMGSCETSTQRQVFTGEASAEEPINLPFLSNYTTLSRLKTCESAKERSQFHKKWSFQDDQRLRCLVVLEHEYNWDRLASLMEVTRQEVVKRWQESIYPQLKLKNRIAGALRWSAVEDSILIEAERRMGEQWQAIVVFLPSRSKFSTEGRWRRLTKTPSLYQQFEDNQGRQSQVDRQAMSKYQYRKHVIRQISAKKQLEQLSSAIRPSLHA